MNRRELFKGALGVTAAVALPSVAIASVTGEDPDRLVTITTHSKAQWAETGDRGKVLGEARIFRKQPGQKEMLLEEYMTENSHDIDLVLVRLSKRAKVGEYISSFTNKEAGYKEIRFKG